MLPFNQTEKSKNRRRQLWETKARRIKVRRKLKSRKKTPRRSTKKISPAKSSSPSAGEHHQVNFDHEGRRKNSHWGQITVKVVEIRGKQIRLGIEAPAAFWFSGEGWREKQRHDGILVSGGETKSMGSQIDTAW
jgi:hypothetical protein